MLKVLLPTDPLCKKIKHNTFKPILSSIIKTKMSPITKHINIPVTDLAPLCGMDHYNNKNKSLCRIWKQLYPSDYIQTENLTRNMGNYCSLDSNINKIKTLEKKSGSKVSASSKVSIINSKKEHSSLALTNNQSVIEKDILKCDKLTTNEKTQMVSLMNSASNVVYGSRNENRGIISFTKITGKKLQDKQGKLIFNFATDEILNGDIVEWNITGKYDGLTTDNEVVEIKNRQRRLFNEIRDYEMCQLQMYLHMVNSNMGYLVEVLGGKTTDDNGINILQARREVNYFTLFLQSYLNDIRTFCLDIPYMSDDDKLKIMSG